MTSDRANWFIALPVPPAQLPADAARSLPPDTCPFHPGDLHITVAFLGAVGEARALHAWSALDMPAGPPVAAAVSGRATFGHPRNPSALGLDLDADRPEGDLVHLIRAWRDPLREAAGVEPERRAVRPHVTLGRPPRRPSSAWWRACRAWLAGTDPAASLRLDRIALYTRARDGDEQRFRIVRSHDWTDAAANEEETR